MKADEKEADESLVEYAPFHAGFVTALAEHQSVFAMLDGTFDVMAAAVLRLQI